MTFRDIMMLNAAHWIAGVLLVFAGVLTLRNAGKPVADQWRPRAAAKAMLGLGLGLIVFEVVDPLLHKAIGGPGDPMMIYHTIIGGLVVTAGVAELYRLRNPHAPRALAWVYPVAWVGVAAVFLIHEQSTDILLYRHWAFALTVAAMGITKLLADLGGREAARRASGLLAIVAGLQFVAYWESPGDHGGGAKPAAHSEH